MGVTAIRVMNNLSIGPVRLLNFETPSDNIENAAVGSSRDFEMWIPWCTSASDFPKRHIELHFSSGKVAYIWQEGDGVRFSTDGMWHKGGDRVPGVSGVDGDRTINVLPDAFTFLAGRVHVAAPSQVSVVVPQQVSAVVPQQVSAVVPQQVSAVVPQQVSAVVPQQVSAVVPPQVTLPTTPGFVPLLQVPEWLANSIPGVALIVALIALARRRSE